MFNPCVEHCFNRFGKQYTVDCDENCEFAKVIKEKKKLELELMLNEEQSKIPISTLEELATQFCGLVECEACPVVIHNFEKRTEYEKTCLHEPCCTNLYKWILEQVKNKGIVKELPIDIKEEIEKYKQTLDFMNGIGL